MSKTYSVIFWVICDGISTALANTSFQPYRVADLQIDGKRMTGFAMDVAEFKDGMKFSDVEVKLVEFLQVHNSDIEKLRVLNHPPLMHFDVGCFIDNTIHSYSLRISNKLVGLLAFNSVEFEISYYRKNENHINQQTLE